MTYDGIVHGEYRVRAINVANDDVIVGFDMNLMRFRIN